jgi:hypothetical protein
LVHRWEVRKASETQYEVVNHETGGGSGGGGIITFTNTTPDCLVLLNDLLSSTEFQWGDTIYFKPSSTPYLCGADLGVARFSKSAVIWGYGATLQTNRLGGAQGAYMFRVTGVGAILTIYGLTMDHHYRGGIGDVQNFVLYPDSTSYGGFIRGEIDVRVGGIRCYDCTFKDLYWYGILFGIPNKDPSTGTPLEDDLHMVFERCSFQGFRHPNGTTELQKGNNFLGADGVGSVTIRDCNFDFNKFWLISARRIYIENVRGKADGYENVPGQALQGEMISVKNVHFSGDTWLLLRSYGGIHSEIVYATGRSIMVDGFVQSGDQPAILVEAQNNSSGRVENVSIRNVRAGMNGIQLTNYNNTDQRPKGKIDFCKIENYICRTFPTGTANPYLVLVQGVDMELLSVHNVKMQTRTGAYDTGGCVVKKVNTPYPISISLPVDVKNVLDPPPNTVFLVG